MVTASEVINSKRDYYRVQILEFIPYDKPIIITGEYRGPSLNEDIKAHIFSNIFPFLSTDEFDLDLITNHAHITEDRNSYKGKKGGRKYMSPNVRYILVCRPYEYFTETSDYPRGGLKLTNELAEYGFNAIMEYSNKLTKYIPFDKVIDFRFEFNNTYAWRKNSSHKISNIVKPDILQQTPSSTIQVDDPPIEEYSITKSIILEPPKIDDSTNNKKITTSYTYASSIISDNTDKSNKKPLHSRKTVKKDNMISDIDIMRAQLLFSGRVHSNKRTAQNMRTNSYVAFHELMSGR